MINYSLIHDSTVYYEAQGFVRIESPWTVSAYIDALTRPVDSQILQLKHNEKCLVGSGEQSFLYLYLKEFLPKGRFQTVTPCFRSDNFDSTHTKYFIKNELIRTDKVDTRVLENTVDICAKFFKQYLQNITIVETSDGFDIEYEGTELGSYGIRENEFLKWIYATGCAEPRLSKVINNTKNGLPSD